MMNDSAIKRRDELTLELERILGILIPQYNPNKIILFGSLAKDHSNETSDIDLMIIKNTPQRYWKRIDEVFHLIHPRQPMDIFVITPNEIKDSLKKENQYLKEILEEGKIVYERAN